MAKERGLPLVGLAAATEQPYEAVPPAVAESLAQDGFDVSAFRPRQVEDADLQEAVRIIAIDCEFRDAARVSANLQRWNDVPKVSADLPGSINAIRRHVVQLVDEFARAASVEARER